LAEQPRTSWYYSIYVITYFLYCEGMESPSSFADRLAALEARVAELEAAGPDESTPAEAGPVDTPVDPGRPEPTPTEAAPAREPTAAAADALPGDADTFWALHGLIDRLGAEGGVTYTGYTTPPGAEDPIAWQQIGRESWRERGDRAAAI